MYTKNRNLKEDIFYVTGYKFPSVFWKTHADVRVLWLAAELRSGSPVLWCCSQNRRYILGAKFDMLEGSKTILA